MEQNSGKYQLMKNGVNISEKYFKNYYEIQNFLKEQNVELSIDQIRRIKKGFYKRPIKSNSKIYERMKEYEIINFKKSS